MSIKARTIKFNITEHPIIEIEDVWIDGHKLPRNRWRMVVPEANGVAVEFLDENEVETKSRPASEWRSGPDANLTFKI